MAPHLEDDFSRAVAHRALFHTGRTGGAVEDGLGADVVDHLRVVDLALGEVIGAGQHHRLGRQRLARLCGRTGLLAAPATDAGRQVEQALLRQVNNAAGAQPQLFVLGVEIDRRELDARALAHQCRIGRAKQHVR